MIGVNVSFYGQLNISIREQASCRNLRKCTNNRQQYSVVLMLEGLGCLLTGKLGSEWVYYFYN